MESCILCLEINNDILDCITTSSARWQELDITKTLETHFWPLNNIQPSSLICLSCWREVDSFHKFYLRIEGSHLNLGKIKVEDIPVPVECKRELELDKSNVAFGFLEPEVLIDHAQQIGLTESEILIDHLPTFNLVVDKKIAINESPDEIDSKHIPLREACKRMRPQSGHRSKDPTEKFKKFKTKKNFKAKFCDEKTLEDNNVEHPKVKEEPVDLNDDYSNSISDNVTCVSDIKVQSYKDAAEVKKRKAYSKHRTNRKENDKFIAEHFKQMFCDLCQVPLEDFTAMQNHFTDVHKQRGYVVCCKRKFFDRARLVDHLHCHLNPDYFKCKECSKAMSDRISFDSHMLRVHRANGKQHRCDLCWKSFTEAYVLRIHKLTHLPEDEKEFNCADCGKNYRSPNLLNQHIQAIHLKRFVKICYICGKTINSSSQFKVHMKKHEGIPLPVVNCDICGLKLISKRGLKLHKESQHPVGGKQEHQCPKCPKISPTLKALKRHINTMHEKGYDHKCSICEKAFKRSEALREHIATHTGTTLYTCPWCPKTFNSNGNMHAHRKKIHPKEWEESKLQKYSVNIPPEI